VKDSNQAMNILAAYDLHQAYDQAARVKLLTIRDKDKRRLVSAPAK